ncbi:cytochrome p450 [Lentinula edodes]|uniref:Cytochrome p450 n=1 Tax=Lentinula edodes TaxID=5353 RepID=A0A1Q3EST0_LENED|nr:cytochrome p450 [Lentinula edodes]
MSSVTIIHSIAVTALLIIIAFAILKGIYNVFFHPLSAIPGPCAKSYNHFSKDMARFIYSVHKFDKSEYYKSLVTNNNDHAMTTLEHAPHSVRRKGYAPHYVPANLAKFQPEMHEPMLELVNNVTNIGGKASIECLTLFRNLMVDVLVSTSYGYRIHAVKKWATDNEDPLSTAISDFPKRGILRSVVPSWAWNVVCRIPVARWRQLCDSDKIMAEFVSERVYQARTEINSGRLDESSETTPLLHRLLKHRYSSTGQMMPDSDIISEAMGHMIAGSDTSSISLSYFLWELSRRPDVAAKLQTELDEAMPNAHVIPDISVLQSLPYLNAFIKEGLRIYSAAPSPLERVVPQSSTKSSEGFDLMGFELPPGTVVATQAWSMHHQPGSAERLARMQQNMMPFGTGSRVCGGQNLAQIMLKVMVAAMARNFDVVAPAETNEKSMDIKDSFVIFPSAMECKLIFNPRSL